MIEDNESECFFQLKPSKRSKRPEATLLEFKKHYDTMNQMQIAAADQESIILSLINKRPSVYQKNKFILQWKENISQQQSIDYVNLIKSESDTFEESENFLRQHQNESFIENYLC